ncbi:MAG: serine hydrolase [Mucilaginibacter sp.]|nr:serine hydrolase [Mucilaginibacter sp.]
MKRILYSLSLMLTFWLPVFSQEKKLDNIIKEEGIPGIQLIYAKGTKIRAFNLGTISQGSTQKVSANTIFEAASLSKSVFTYAVLRLYDRGILSLDTPLLHYIGSYARFDPKDSRYAKITARMVLRHTTGLPNWGDNAGVRLIFSPDSTFSYSGEGFLFLQRVVEKKLNKSLGEIAKEEVFKPLKMESSSYAWTDKYDTVAAFGNSTEQVNRHKNENAAYSLLTNAHDYSVFLEAVITGRGLKPETRKMMFEKSSAGNRFGKPVIEANQHINWGLGFGLTENEKGKAIWHWGDNGNFKCFYLAYPATNERLVYFTNSQDGLNILGDVLDLFYGKQTWWPAIWLQYGYESPKLIKEFQAKLTKVGFEHAPELFAELKKKDSNYKLPEDDVNKLGYKLLRQGKKKEALEIFKLNVSLYPDIWNTYDSLGEAYWNLDDKVLAIKNYTRSLELNPQNTNAIESLKKIEQPDNK